MKAGFFPASCLALLLPAVSLPCAVFSRVLNVCDDVADPLTLDPQKQFSEKNYTICWQIFDGLVRFDPDGKIEPALAVSWERLDKTRVRFKLREGVSFHNGEPFNAESVKFSIERYLNPETGFPGLYFVDSLARAEVIDARTVDLVTKYPDGILLNRLAGLVLMVPPEYIKEKGAEYFAQNPVGTGAFVFKKWEKGSSVQLDANKEYWLKGFPKVDGLVFKFIPYEKQLKALFSGEVDLVTDLPGTQTLKVMENPRFAVLKKASFYTMPFSLNLSSGPLSNLDVRRALNHAVDKESLIRYDLMGNGQPIATLSMPGETGHNSSLRPYEYNPGKARKLLAKAGYPGGFTLEFLVKKNAERTAKIVAANLKRIGVNLNITLVSDADMVKEFKSRKYDMFIADVPDPMCHSYFVQSIVLFSKSPYAWGGDAKFDEMLMKMVA
ncbi:MAG: ABC transporter substrate-binding protein, partial [Elusimicrobia bacterium]|nr:ABC transporter substrate-binding protein [Elusimicrobiota bacterium]